jgi:hypothetical protein
MITIEDCITLCGLNREEVMAIAEHEHVHDALSSGDRDHASQVLVVLRHFLDTHPEATKKGRQLS